jgi:hypothetical protein
MISFLLPFYSENWCVSCTSVPFLFCSILLSRFNFLRLKREPVEYSTNQTNLVSSFFLNIRPQAASVPSTSCTHHLHKKSASNVQYNTSTIFWNDLPLNSDKDWIHFSIKSLRANVRKAGFFITLLQLFPHLKSYSTKLVKGKNKYKCMNKLQLVLFLTNVHCYSSASWPCSTNIRGGGCKSIYVLNLNAHATTSLSRIVITWCTELYSGIQGIFRGKISKSLSRTKLWYPVL